MNDPQDPQTPSPAPPQPEPPARPPSNEVSPPELDDKGGPQNGGPQRVPARAAQAERKGEPRPQRRPEPAPDQRTSTEDSTSGGVFAAAVQDIQRLREITAVLARHGFGRLVKRVGLEKIVGDRFAPTPDTEPVDPADRRGTARQLRLVFEELGPTFIKLGQLLSTRPDLLPQVVIREFEKLQDRVPPMPFEQVRAQLEAGLGVELVSGFEHIEPNPLATASIGQVHEARLPDGRRVVVKVLRSGVAEQIRSDLDILYFLSRIIRATIEESDIYNIGEIVREFDRAISQEIDFLNEARNLQRFTTQCANQPRIVIPEVITALSNRRVLTLEFLDGERITHTEAGSEEAEHIVEALMNTAYEQVFVHGLFHADPHPGNLFVLEGPRLAMLDFGLVGQLSRSQQDDLVALVLTIVNGDIDGIARTVLRMGVPLTRVNLAEFKREIASMRERYFNKHLDEIDVSAFSMDLMDLALRHRIKINSEYSLLAKATVTLEGVLRRLDPTLDLATAAAPFARRLLTERYNSRRLLQTLFSGALSLSSFLQEVPAQLDQVLMDIESGTATINVRNEEIDRLGAQLSSLATRVFLGLICCGLLIGGSIMLAQLSARLPPSSLLALMSLAMFSLAGTIAFWALAWPLARTRLGRIRIRPIFSLLSSLRKRGQ